MYHAACKVEFQPCDIFFFVIKCNASQKIVRKNKEGKTRKMTNTTASQHTPQHIPFSSLYACCYWCISDMVLLQTVLRVAVRRSLEPSHKPTRHCGGGLKIPALSSFEHRTRQLLLIMVALRATSSSLALRHRPSSCYRLRLR